MNIVAIVYIYFYIHIFNEHLQFLILFCYFSTLGFSYLLKCNPVFNEFHNRLVGLYFESNYFLFHFLLIYFYCILYDY